MHSVYFNVRCIVNNDDISILYYIVNLFLTFFLYWIEVILTQRCSGLCSACHSTVLSAGFSIFVHWKFAENRVHNLRLCTEFIFPVYSRKYYSLYTGSFLPTQTHVRYISRGNFCAPEYCSVFAGIQLASAVSVQLVAITL